MPELQTHTPHEIDVVTFAGQNGVVHVRTHENSEFDGVDEINVNKQFRQIASDFDAKEDADLHPEPGIRQNNTDLQSQELRGMQNVYSRSRGRQANPSKAHK